MTARRESEAELRRSEQLLRTTTANTADTLILVDTDLRVRFINKGRGGMTIEEIVGCEISAMLPEPARGFVVAEAAAGAEDRGDGDLRIRVRGGRERNTSKIARCRSATTASARASPSA